MNKVTEFLKNVWNKVTGFVCPLYAKVKEWIKTIKWKVVWDHFTTGLLIFLMASPILILVYIFLWFVIRQL